MNIRERYKIPAGAKIILYVGNISRNKNQLQMVDAFDLLPRSLADNAYVLFCGEENDASISLPERISKSAFASHLIMCGGVPRQNMPDYYKSADAVVLLSFAEGFGLSLAEGMYFGLPSMTFSDLSAFQDLYEPESMVAITSRKDADVASALQTLLSTTWNRDVIRKLSNKFSSSNMADSYIAVYHKVLSQRSSL